jgi:hypothetical protein
MMQEKARQVEAKNGLAGIYTSEQSFYAEYDSYSSEFDQVGAGFDGVMHYMVGFSNGYLSPNPAAPPHPSGGKINA